MRGLYLKTSKVLWLGVIVAALIGCGESEESNIFPLDTDPNSGRSSYVLDLIVNPPSSSTLPTFHLPRTQVQDEFTLSLPRAITYDIVVIEPSTNQAVDAEVLFSTESRLSGRRSSTSFPVSDDETTSIRLSPGTYDIRVSPLDRRFPPYEVYDFRVETEPTTRRRKEFIMPDSFRRLEGIVRSRISLTNIIPGAIIFARGETSGLISTTSQSNENGLYTLLLPDSRDTQYQLTATLPDELQPAWTYQQVIRVGIGGEDRIKDIDIDKPSEAVQGSLTLDIIGNGLDGPESIPEALCVLSLNEAAPDNNSFGRTYELRGLTNQQGRVIINDSDSLPILRGTYTVSIFPGQESPFATYTGLLELPEIGANINVNRQVVLEPRALISGRIIEEDGTPSPLSQVRFLSNTTRNPTPFLETADALGVFSIYLDPDEYVMVAESSSHLGYLAQIISVPANTTELILAPDRVQLQPMTAVSGYIVQSTGESVANAEISEVVEVGNTTVSRNTTTSDTNGAFTLFLPAPPLTQ